MKVKTLSVMSYLAIVLVIIDVLFNLLFGKGIVIGLDIVELIPLIFLLIFPIISLVYGSKVRGKLGGWGVLLLLINISISFLGAFVLIVLMFVLKFGY